MRFAGGGTTTFKVVLISFKVVTKVCPDAAICASAASTLGSSWTGKYAPISACLAYRSCRDWYRGCRGPFASWQ